MKRTTKKKATPKKVEGALRAQKAKMKRHREVFSEMKKTRGR